MLQSLFATPDSRQELLSEYTGIGQKPRCSDAAKAAVDVCSDVLSLPISSLEFFAGEKAIAQGNHLPLLDFTCGVSLITSSLLALKGNAEVKRALRSRDHFSLALGIHKLTQFIFVASSACFEMVGKVFLGLSHIVRHEAFQKLALGTLRIANYITIPIGAIRLVGNGTRLFVLRKMQGKMKKVEDLRSPMAILERLRRKAVQRGVDARSENQILQKASQLERAFGCRLTEKILACDNKKLALELLDSMKGRLQGELIEEGVTTACNLLSLVIVAVVGLCPVSAPVLVALVATLFLINLVFVALDCKNFVEELEDKEVGRWDTALFSMMGLCSVLSIVFASFASATPAALIFSLSVSSMTLLASFIILVILYRA